MEYFIERETYKDSSDELMHYGTLGMKWGVRRFQNADGTLTAAGKKQYRTQLKEDNKKAFENGKNATITGKAVNYAMKRTIKDENKLEKALIKDPNILHKSTQKKYKNVMVDYETTRELQSIYDKNLDRAKKHCDELIQRYGKENVKGINYKEYSNDRLGSYKLANERVVSGKDVALSTAASIGYSAVLQAMGTGLYMISIPASGNDKGRRLYKNTRNAIKLNS